MKKQTLYLWFFFGGIAAMLLGHVDLFGGYVLWVMGCTVLVMFDALASAAPPESR